MRATSQQPVITAVFEAAERATDSLSHLVPDIDRDRVEYALASVLLEEGVGRREVSPQPRGAAPPSAKPS